MRIAAVAFALVLAPAAAFAAPCKEWLPPERAGTLDPQFLTEESGIAVSRLYRDRLYHNNDSGDGPFFYITDGSGAATRRIAVTGFVPRDVEDIALGGCAGGASCLFLGDIGDNSGTRSSVTFVEVAEQDAFPDEVAPLRIVEARYPDGPHNAEGFAIHPNGDLFLITKDVDPATKAAAPASIFRLTAAQLAAPPGEPQTFTFVGSLDLPRYIALAATRFVRNAYSNQIATALDISADGSRAAVLTYGEVFEWNQDLARPFPSERALEPGHDFTLTELPPLLQAESIAYLPDRDGIVYSSEAPAGIVPAPLYRQLCVRR